MSVRAHCFVAAAVLLLGACSPAATAPKAPLRPQTEWTGEMKQLFDDGIDLGALPLQDETTPGRDESNEELIPQRIDTADGVVLAKVIGFHAEPIGADRKRYRVELNTEGAPLVGKSPSSPFTIQFEPESPGYGSMRALDSRLINRKIVLFYRTYADESGSAAVIHFHISPATKPVLDAIALHKTRRQFD